MLPDFFTNQNSNDVERKPKKKNVAFIVSLLLILALASGFGVYQLVRFFMGMDYENIVPTEKRMSPYLVSKNIDDIPAHRWALSQSLGGNDFSTTSEEPLFNIGVCSSPVGGSKVDDTFISSYHSVGDQEIRTISLYGPGAAQENFYKYLGDLKNCSDGKGLQVKNVEGDKNPYVISGNWFTAVVGDAIVREEFSSTKVDDKLVKSQVGKLNDSLNIGSQCLASEHRNDYKRNQAFGDKYEGFRETKEIKSSVPHSDPVNVKFPKVHSIDNENMKAPEGPLSNSIPEKVEFNTIKKPAEPKLNAEKYPTDFTENVSYQVYDDNGPGCGWDWSNWKRPDENQKDLTERAENVVSDANNRVKSKADEVSVKKAEHDASALGIMSEVNRWNVYADEVNDTHKKWDWLNKERQKVKKPWDEYMKKYVYWRDFEKIQESTEQDYKEAAKKCSDDREALADWESKYEDTSAVKKDKYGRTASPSPSPSPSRSSYGSTEYGSGYNSIPPKPKGCDKSPEYPKILSEDRPKEPAPPAIPKDVTIPQSWDKR